MQTRASLLIRIRDPKDGLAWSEFVRLYAPLLHSYGMKNRLQDSDAADLTQDTLRLVFRAAPEFADFVLTRLRQLYEEFQAKS